MVQQTLERRAARRMAVRSLDDTTAALVQAVVDELQELGLVDDVSYAETRAASLAAKGLSRRRIARGLSIKGIAEEAIAKAIPLDVDELTQARRLVARKRLGHLRPDGTTPDMRRKDLAVLARAGFAFAIASRALEAPDDT